VFDRSNPRDYLVAVGGYGASNDRYVDDDEEDKDGGNE